MKGIKSVHFPNYAEKSFMSYEVNGKLMLNLLELITNWQKLYNIQRLTPQISSPLNLCKSRTNASSLIQPLQRRNDITIEICAWRFKLNIIQLQKIFSVTSPDELLLWDAAVAVNVEGFKQLPVAQIIIIKWCNYLTITLQDNYITGQIYYMTTTQNDKIAAFYQFHLARISGSNLAQSRSGSRALCTSFFSNKIVLAGLLWVALSPCELSVVTYR